MAIVAFALIAVVMPTTSISEDTDADVTPIEGTGLSWEVSSNQLRITVTNVSGSKDIPSTYTESTHAPWYTNYRTTVTSISIGDGVTGVGQYSFYGMTAVTNVTFPISITTIGAYAFYGCTALTTVNLVNTNYPIQIGNYAFRDCSSLNMINLNTPSISSLGSGAFLNCTSLTEAQLGTFTGTAIPSDIFEGCSNLKTVSLPSGITEIGNHAFSGCSKISYISFGNSLTTIGPSTFYGIHFIGTTGELPQSAENIKGKTWTGSGDGRLFAASPQEYTITFMPQGGVASTTTMTTVDGKLPSLPTATYGSKHFDGWFTSPTGGSIISLSTVFSKDETVYALWDTAISVTGVTLDQTTTTLYMGSTLKLNATVSPATATDPSVVWNSSDKTVATVDNGGNITPIKTGTTRITVTTNDGGKTATCDVTVQHVPVESITLNKTSDVLSVTGTLTLTPTITPTTADVKTVTWESSAPAIATVDQNGVVTAVAAGTATITVKTVVSEKTATCTITVAAKRVTDLTLQSTANMNTGGKLTLTATITPNDADVKTVTWSSSNEEIAKVDKNSGEITALKAGQVNITATTVDGGFTKTCAVTITDSVFSATTILIIVVIAVIVIAVGAVFYLKKSGTLGGNFGGKGGKKKNGGDGSTGVTPLRPINKP